MRLLTSPDQIVKYMELIKAQPDYVPKTRLQKIEALKKAIKWLKSCSYMMDSPYAGGADRNNLDHILVMMNKECNDLRPYAKADEGRCSLLSSHIAKNAYLSMDNFAELGRSLLEQLDKQHNNIAEFKGLALRPDVIKNADICLYEDLDHLFLCLVADTAGQDCYLYGHWGYQLQPGRGQLECDDGEEQLSATWNCRCRWTAHLHPSKHVAISSDCGRSDIGDI